MEITENEIKRLASLSRLQFNDDEMQKIAEDMSSIVSYVNELQRIDTTSIQDNTTIREFCELRDDEVKESLPNEAIIGNAPKKINGYFIAPTVVE